MSHAARTDAAVVISHPEKLLFPADGISKGELAAYYQAIAPLMLPHLAGRPVTMERFPAGIERKGFLQKNVVSGFPGWLKRVEVPHKQGPVHYPLIDDVRSLAWLANQNCITPHVWCSRHPTLDHPDLCVLDLDPSREDPDELRSAALAVRALLEELNLPSWVKTSGSKGFHIVVPLEPATRYEELWRFAHGVGALLAQRHPALLTQEFLKTERAGRILIDTGRSGPGATFAAAYAVRPRPGAPVSAPCTWPEIESGAALPQSFTLRGMASRAQQLGDPWAQLHSQPCSLVAPLQRLEALLSPEDWERSLAAITRRPKPRQRRSPG
ncbi:MAG TPA: non-homologous end-joining DNA ligase [Polyangiaceae bacterium]|nr:non-homologous end-joining DNA ligase [Polyangiaceae bacterium]